MSKSRKVLGALLAIVMVLSVISISAFAAGATYYEEDASYTQSWSLGTPVQVSGNQYKVEVKLSTNYLVGPVSFKLEGVTTIDSVVVGAGYYPGALTDKANSGLILMIPDTADTVLGKSCNSAVIATVTYTTSAANGVVSIANNPKNANNPNGTLVAARLTETTVNDSDFIVGQVATVDGATVNPPAGDVTLEGTKGAVVDDENGYVYGVPASTADVKSYLTTTGYVEIEANDAGAKNGTGAEIKLYADSSKAGGLVESYTLVVFGDVNGDGALSLEDAGAVGQVANYLGDPFTGAYAFAADVNCDEAVSLEDAGTIGQVANYLSDPITNPWA